MASALTTASTDENARPQAHLALKSPPLSVSKAPKRVPRPSLTVLGGAAQPHTNKRHSHGDRLLLDRRQLLRAGSVEIDIQLPTSDGVASDVEHAFGDEDASNNTSASDDDANDMQDGTRKQTQAVPMLPTPPTSQSPTKAAQEAASQLAPPALPNVKARLRSRSPATQSQSSTAKAFNVYQPPPLRRKSISKPKGARKAKVTEAPLKARQPILATTKKAATTQKAPKTATGAKKDISKPTTTKPAGKHAPKSATRTTTRRRSSTAAVRKPSPTETLPEPTGEGSDGDDPLLLKDPEELRGFGEGRPLWFKARSRSQSTGVASVSEPDDSDASPSDSLDRTEHRQDSVHEASQYGWGNEQHDLGGYEAPGDYSDGPYQFCPQGQDSDSDDGEDRQHDGASESDGGETERNQADDDADESEAEPVKQRGGRLQTEEAEDVVEGDSQDVTVILDISTDTVPYPEQEYEVAIPPMSSSPARHELDQRQSPSLSPRDKEHVKVVQADELPQSATGRLAPLPPVSRDVGWTRGPAFFRSTPSPAASPSRSLHVLTPPKDAPPTPPKENGSGSASTLRARSNSMATSEAPSSPSIRRSKSSSAMSDVSMSSPARAGSIMDVLMSSPSPIKRSALVDSPKSRLYPVLPSSPGTKGISDTTMVSPSPVKQSNVVPGSLERLRIGGIVQAGRDTLSRLLFGKTSPKASTLSMTTVSSDLHPEAQQLEEQEDKFDSQEDEDEVSVLVSSTTAEIASTGEDETNDSSLEDTAEIVEPEDRRQVTGVVTGKVSDDDDYDTTVFETRATEARLTPVPSRLSLPSTTYGRLSTSTVPRSAPRSTTGAPIVSVSSTDPKAAARAAAILKVYHDYIDQGLEVPETVLRDVGIRRSAIKGRYIGRAEAGKELIQEAVEDLIGSPRGLVVAIAAADAIEEDAKTRSDDVWSTSDWRNLERTLIDEARQMGSKSSEVDAEVVVERFLRGKAGHAGAEWSREMLFARVHAIQKRRSRDAQKRVAHETVFDSTSSTRYRTLDNELVAFEHGQLFRDREGKEESEEEGASEDDDSDEQGYNVEDDTFFERTRPSAKPAPAPALAGNRFSHLFDRPVSKPTAPVPIDSFAQSNEAATSTVKKVSSMFSARESSEVQKSAPSALASSEPRRIAPLRAPLASTSVSTLAFPSTPPVASPYVRSASSAAGSRGAVALQQFSEKISRRRQSLAVLDKRRRSSTTTTTTTMPSLYPSFVLDSGHRDRGQGVQDHGSGKVWTRVVELEEAESSREEEQARVLELMGSLKKSTSPSQVQQTVKRKASWTVNKSVAAERVDEPLFVGSARGLRRTSATLVGQRRQSAGTNTPVAFVPNSSSMPEDRPNEQSFS
ncbi:hypothetical protein OIV83_005549 [Microbotryomycetes sp. JL201]|nr:hypothetical protein OIV83_005549 [Microbotryomycetes sp. JL201]